jgi:hypothetical protein
MRVSGGSLVQRGPAYTQLSLFARIDAQGRLELVNHLAPGHRGADAARADDGMRLAADRAKAPLEVLQGSAGLCNNSGGSLVQRGPAYTQLSLFARIDAQGRLELVRRCSSSR